MRLWVYVWVFFLTFILEISAEEMIISKKQEAQIKMPIQKSTFSFQSARQTGGFQRLKAFR